MRRARGVSGRIRPRRRQKLGGRRTFGAPREVSCVKAKGAVLEVASADADQMDALGSELGHGGLTAEKAEAYVANLRREKRYQRDVY